MCVKKTKTKQDKKKMDVKTLIIDCVYLLQGVIATPENHNVFITNAFNGIATDCIVAFCGYFPSL